MRHAPDSENTEHRKMEMSLARCLVGDLRIDGLAVETKRSPARLAHVCGVTVLPVLWFAPRSRVPRRDSQWEAMSR